MAIDIFLININRKNSNNNCKNNQKKLILIIKCQGIIAKIAKNVIV